MQVLQSNFPYHNWNQSMVRKESNNFLSETQYLVYSNLTEIFPSNVSILQNYRHPALLSDKSGAPIELDMWVPAYNIAFEYHGTSL